jgi:hypothetical protein
MSYSPFRDEVTARGQIDYIAYAVEMVRRAWMEFEPQIRGEWSIETNSIDFHLHETWKFGGEEDHYWSIPLEAFWNLEGVLEKVRIEKAEQIAEAKLTAVELRRKREDAYDRYLVRQAKARGLIPQDVEFVGTPGEARAKENR